MSIPFLWNTKLMFRSRSFKNAVFWVFGLLLGTLFAAGLDISFLSLMRRFFTQPVSIVILLILAVLPFLICTYAFIISRMEIMYAVLFCKAFFISLIALTAYRIFGSSGWLLQPMIQFSDILLAPVLYWFCNSKGRTWMRDHFICIGAVLITVLMHGSVVLAFVAQLID